jgi:hypothetical protein
MAQRALSSSSPGASPVDGWKEIAFWSSLPATMLRHLSLLTLIALVAPLRPAEAQAVLVLWGDSVVCGYGADARTGTPYGAAPFGDPLEGAWRWAEREQRWVELTPLQNHQGTGADLAYGAAAAWLAVHPGQGPVHVVALGLPGADVGAGVLRASSSWAPNVVGGALQRFLARSLRPALASLPAPRVEWICGSAGNNAVRDWSQFQVDLRATFDALLAEVSGAPRTLMLRSIRRTDVEARQAIAESGHGVVDLDPLPKRIDGVQNDGVHLTHYGNVCAGIRVAWTAMLMPGPVAPQPAAQPRVEQSHTTGQ